MPRDPYHRFAGVYDTVIEPMQAGVRRVALQTHPPQPAWSVLDVGCGTGAWLVPYLEAGCTAAGVEVSAAMYRKAVARLGDRADLRLTDGERLPFDRSSFDLVLTSLVLHEIPAGGRATFIGEMVRVAKPEGRLLFVDFRFGSLRGWRGPVLRALSTVIERLSGHYDNYRTFAASGGLPAEIEEVGLEVEREKIVAGGNLAISIVPPHPVERHA